MENIQIWRCQSMERVLCHVVGQLNEHYAALPVNGTGVMPHCQSIEQALCRVASEWTGVVGQ